MDLNDLDVRTLHVGDTVTLSGLIITGRDRFHKYMHDGGTLPPDIDLSRVALYHCGPIVMATAEGGWHVVAAGPTTSSREEPYEADLIVQHGLRIIIGKGGMGAKTLAACQKYGCIYVQAVGGAAAQIASTITAVEGVDYLDTFGDAEAMWRFRVKDFTGIVGMDTHGQSLFDTIKAQSAIQLDILLNQV